MKLDLSAKWIAQKGNSTTGKIRRRSDAHNRLMPGRIEFLPQACGRSAPGARGADGGRFQLKGASVPTSPNPRRLR